jgi:hypothetical protein
MLKRLAPKSAQERHLALLDQRLEILGFRPSPPKSANSVTPGGWKAGKWSEEIDLAAETGEECLMTGRTDVRESKVQVFEPVVGPGRPLFCQ